MAHSDHLLIVVGMLALVAASLAYARYRVDAIDAAIAHDIKVREHAGDHLADWDSISFHHSLNNAGAK